MTVVRIDTRKIVDWASFHDLFAEVFGFPEYYGRNMNAWIDCMTYLDEPEGGMSTIPVDPGSAVVLDLEDVADFAARCPELYLAIIEGAAFVNWRRMDLGDCAILACSFCKNP